MHRRISTVLVVGALLVLVFASVAAAAGTLTVESATAPYGGQVRIEITVESPTRVAGYQLNLTYDPQVVRVVRIEGGNFSAPVANINNSAGWAFFTQARPRGIRNPTLAVMVFNVTGTVGSETRLDVVAADTLVSDEQGQEIDVTFEDGRITVGTATATPTATATDTATATATPTESTTTAPPDTTVATTATTTEPTERTTTTTTVTRTDGATDTTADDRDATTTGGTEARTPIRVETTTTTTVPSTTTKTPSQPGFATLAAVLGLVLFVLYRRRRS